jgi:asparagine synthase (glutamine-hydrolysing)
MQQFDQPFADSSAIPTNLISRAVREHVKVVIGGDGGDEMFGGYARFRHADLAQRIGHAPDPLRAMARWANHATKSIAPDRWRQGTKLLQAAELRDGNRLTRLSAYHPPWALADLLQTDTLDHAQPFISALISESSRINDPDGSDYLDLTVETALPGDYLRKVDVMSAAHGLEARVPFLGSQVLALSQTLPEHLRYSRQQNKLLLRALADRYLPESIVTRPKAGFNLPFDTWLGTSERAQLHAELVAEDAPIKAIVRSEWIERVAGEFAFGPRDRARWSRFGLYQRAFMLWVLNNWLKQWQPVLK